MRLGLPCRRHVDRNATTYASCPCHSPGHTSSETCALSWLEHDTFCAWIHPLRFQPRPLPTLTFPSAPLRFSRPPYVSLGPIIQVIFTVRGEEETQWDEESTHMQYNSQTKVHDTIREWRTHCDSRLFFECQV